MYEGRTFYIMTDADTMRRLDAVAASSQRMLNPKGLSPVMEVLNGRIVLTVPPELNELFSDAITELGLPNEQTTAVRQIAQHYLSTGEIA